MDKIGVIGAGTMGHGIAQVSAMAGYDVTLTDANADVAEKGRAAVESNLDKGVLRGKVTEDQRRDALSKLTVGGFDDACTEASIIIEAVPEKLELKQAIFRQAEALAPTDAVFATNTSSLSITAIAEGVDNPSRVIGAHFFNPVHIMALLELVVGDQTADTVLARTRAFGDRIGKDVIVVRDRPGFATSRLGVALGMEAIRMVEESVASPEDIDKAMVLGYRHPVGPLKLTDMVGLDVRLHIGEYLAKALHNPAFEPPTLMRKMVADGRLGKKAGRGFYDW